MQNLLSIFIAAALMLPSLSTAQPLNTDDEKLLYTIGLSLAQNLTMFELSPAEFALVQRGMNDKFNNKPQLKLEEWGPKLQAFAQARVAIRSKKESEKGKAFLDAAAKEPGAEQTASGLVFKSIKAGTGKFPTTKDKVEVHYRGTLTDGTEFDSSYARNAPAKFPLGGVVKCWQEGLQKMKVGGKARLVCPASIAYGDRGAPPKIGPGATLVFEVELLNIIE